LGNSGQIRTERKDLLFIIENNQKIIPPPIDFQRFDAQAIKQQLRRFDFSNGIRREIKIEGFLFLSHVQKPTAGRKSHRITGKISMIEENMGRRQGSVTAQVNFDRGSKPSDMIDRISGFHKSGLRQIVFCRNGLHGFLGQFRAAQDHCGRIPFVQFLAESIDLVQRQLHEFIPFGSVALF
jgi:hypothetical protein